MAGNYRYNALANVHELQPVIDAHEASHEADPERQPLDQETTRRPPPTYDMKEKTAFASVNSFETFKTGTSSTTSFEKLKKLGNRIRRKPLPQYLRGSIQVHPAAEIEPSRVGKGVWQDQLLIDRSLRGMAALMTLFAIGMVALVVSYAGHFRNRGNVNTTSVGGDVRSCKEVTQTNTAFLLLINVCATMILGMSNTYQQLVTSIKISDLKHMLSKFGDSRVGTNSPFNINQKRDGRKWSWAVWIFLVLTSMPVHFLANSLIGPSFIQTLPQEISFHEVANMTSSKEFGNGINKLVDPSSFICWSALKTGKPHFPGETFLLGLSWEKYSTRQQNLDTVWGSMQVRYDSNCSSYLRTETDIRALERSYVNEGWKGYTYREGDCVMGTGVLCTLHDEAPTKCRLNVRMSAAIILATCLVLKAVYMLSVNLLARGKLKSHCLTFGDVIVASASHPELRVQGECMVNGGDNYRRHNSHTCHKHCRGVEDSKTGDELGHCQKCKKWNSANKFSNEPQPTIATKFKKSLISNLGNTALTQMCLLMLCTLALMGASITIAVLLGTRNEAEKERCQLYDNNSPYCSMSDTNRFAQLSGGWGGFNQSLIAATMDPDSLGNEVLSFAISNGAQFIYSLLYLMMIYNITLISQEADWGRLEYGRKRLRTTLVAGESFAQDYLLQLPKKILFPTMAYSVLTHWMLGEALQTQEAIWLENDDGRHIEHSRYNITYAAYPVWTATFLSLLMTSVCWWAFTYKREGFIPQMFGSIRVLCAATTQLDDFPSTGIQWGDLGEGLQFRHAGLAAEQVTKIVPNALYAGRDTDTRKQGCGQRHARDTGDWTENYMANGKGKRRLTATFESQSGDGATP
ncbi:hypothetical protein E8E13_005808 [Curvularia kusanoi]|uniref:DUF6536 domain-containing protein n=1 Tax=Curvularia kusanoi TaxID=90978 RepID=A0A9P4WAR5_CURKU|nr:hypothetical protein E8E13_005808 [Curvularia kusanoi]